MSGTLLFRNKPAPAWLLGSPAESQVVPIGKVFEKTKTVPGSGLADAYKRLSLTMQGVLPRSRDADDGLQPTNFDGYQLLRPGQLVFKLIDLENVSTSRVGLSDLEGLVSPAYMVLIPRPVVNPRYAVWFFLDLYNRRVYNNLGEDGVRSSLGWDTLKNLPFVLPPLATQERIVRFLDVETAKIDKLIAREKEAVTLLRLRAEAHEHALFAQADVDREEPLKRVLTKLSRPVAPQAGVITAYRDGQVTLRSNRRDDGYTFSDTETGYQGIEPGDLVFHGLDGFAGAVGVSDSQGQSTPVYHVCRVTNRHDSVDFIARYLRHLGLSGFLATLAPSVRQRSVDFRNWQTFGRVPLALPTRVRQDQVIAELTETDRKLESATQKLERSIDLLSERRSALITAAVTGQIEV